MSKLLDYHRTIGAELTELKNRVRHLLGDTEHWLSDGRHKESILKNVLERHLPETISASNGFIRYPETCSSEIDLVLYNNSKPLLFKSNDLVITTPSTIFGAIEVKTKLRTDGLEAVLAKLSDNSEKTINQIHSNAWENLDFSKGQLQTHPWFSLFCYDSEVPDRKLLECLKDTANRKYERAVKCISLGEDKFIRFWVGQKKRPYDNESFTGWKLYKLKGLSFSYFISNMIWQDQLLTSENSPWFALNDKETELIDSIEF